MLARSWQRLRTKFTDPAKARLFTCLKPFQTGGRGLPSQKESAAELGIPIETLLCAAISPACARVIAFLREDASTITAADLD